MGERKSIPQSCLAEPNGPVGSPNRTAAGGAVHDKEQPWPAVAFGLCPAGAAFAGSPSGGPADGTALAQPANGGRRGGERETRGGVGEVGVFV